MTAPKSKPASFVPVINARFQPLRLQQLWMDIETALYNREDREIPTMVIGELVMDHLKDLDPVAYVRFASVYREFKDIDTFMDEIKSLLSSN